MTLHCFLAGHDVGDHPDRCVHCGIRMPIQRFMIAREAILRGLAVIVFVALFAGVRLAKESMRPRLMPELDGLRTR